jgi:hypothetical protein
VPSLHMLRCNEVSRQSAASGQSRRFGHVLGMSALAPITKVSLLIIYFLHW